VIAIQTRLLLPRVQMKHSTFGAELVAALERHVEIERGEREPARISVRNTPDLRRKPSWVRGRHERGGRNRTHSPYILH